MISRQTRATTVAEVAAAVIQAHAAGEHLVPRGGGHCFAGRSSAGDVILDLTGLDTISVAADGTATIGAGALLAQVYDELHAYGRALPAGCGPTVGIAGLALGGGIGLIGRKYGLTCDRLVGAQLVLADGSVVETDETREPDLFWALRGAGGGQFGVVTVLRFDTVSARPMTRIAADWVVRAPEELVAAWQAWAPDTPDDLTVNLTLVSQPGRTVRAVVTGASLLAEDPTRELLQELGDLSGTPVPFELHGGMSLRDLKRSLADPSDYTTRRIRSEFFGQALTDGVLSALLTQLRTGGERQLSFTAMGGAYNRVGVHATAFAHRNERFLLEHVAVRADPWIDASWTTAHADGSGHVYPNFPDPALADAPTAYHGANLARLRAVKNAYDPEHFFHFPQGL
ncbi:FAD-binding oxidoreductase [Kribbella sp. NPDC004536]|uniref:FAD-binding oxidoreductase n=1 Tax=Kribbella sp. NPDC004536 TaxID=3364106 RepID=UPI003675DEBA